MYRIVKKICERWLNFSFILKKQQFLEMCQKEFGLDSTDEGKRLYKMFKVRNPQGRKVVNVLEILSVLILHSEFGQTNEKDLMHNSELIEHKMNLMLILFDLRDSAKINVVEVMIMARTVM